MKKAHSQRNVNPLSSPRKEAEKAKRAAHNSYLTGTSSGEDGEKDKKEKRAKKGKKEKKEKESSTVDDEDGDEDEEWERLRRKGEFPPQMKRLEDRFKQAEIASEGWKGGEEAKKELEELRRLTMRLLKDMSFALQKEKIRLVRLPSLSCYKGLSFSNT